MEEIALKQKNQDSLWEQIRKPLYLLQNNHTFSISLANETQRQNITKKSQDFTVIGVLPALYPEQLGNQRFLSAHSVRFPYAVGEMANGIATAQMVITSARAGCMAFFGAAGLPIEKVAQNIHYIQSQLSEDQLNWGSNLIHSPYEPALEEKLIELYLNQNVHRVSASAYMQVNAHIVHYACKGLHQDPQGRICRVNHVFAKISRPEVGKQFMEPASPQILKHLLDTGKITEQEAHLAQYIPIAQDVTVESDSGGHTDNRPLTALFPAIQCLRETIQKEKHYPEPIRLGAAGGIGTPNAAAAAFSLGADYILTGSINQCAIESGLSEYGKTLLSQADIADISMAPAADMFELGVNVQVLKRGTLFANRAKKLFELYKAYESIEEIPISEQTNLEKYIFKAPIQEIWQQTMDFFTLRNPEELRKAEKSSKHQMALIFRWYLGLSSTWSINGDQDRTSDYQIWCGPAMGAFNRWVKGSFLEALQNRTVVQIALNILEGAAVVARAQQLRSYNVDLPSEAFHFKPRVLG